MQGLSDRVWSLGEKGDLCLTQTPSPRHPSTWERRKARKASCEEDTELEWAGGWEMGWRARAACLQDEETKAKRQEGVRDGQESSLSCAPDPLAPSQCTVPQ